MKKIMVGSRGSKLALAQTNLVIEELKRLNSSYSFEVKIIKTKGDLSLNSSLDKEGGKGLFVKEIEEALIKEEIDLAIHSMKDLPTELPSELTMAAILPRINPKDALISKNGHNLLHLPPRATVGTSSLRRKVQLLNLRRDLNVVEIRGNLDTRIKKLKEGSLEAIIVAVCGLIRLNLIKLMTQELPIKAFLPAAGQGALGIEVRKEDCKIRELAEKVNCLNSQWEVRAERSFLKELGGGCQVPIGVLAQTKDKMLLIQGMVSSLDGQKVVKDKMIGKKTKAEDLGKELATRLLNKEANEIIKELKREG
ncbi:hydroxymethylbilane synthase [bacterium]|nr:hydroxymethylbilane synthase [bacterium]